MKIKRVRIKFDKFLHDTGKAVLVRIGREEYWIGHFMIKDLVINKKLGGHLSTTPEVCEEKGIHYDESMAVETFHHHIPEKLDKSKITHDKNLER